MSASLCFASPFILGGLSYVIVRIQTLSKSAFGVNSLIQGWHYDLYDTFRISFKVFGFYVKKLFVPVPLNFAIREVAEIYVFVGMVVLVFSLFMIYKRVVFFWPFAVGFYLIAPAILIALTGVAWTPVAERYIYLSEAFTVIGLSACLFWLGRHLPLRAGLIGLTVLLVSATSVTAHRNYLWQDNGRLFADTQEKSDFSAIDNELGIALIKSGDLEKAKEVLLAAIAEGKGEENPLIYVNLSLAYQQEADYENAEKTLDLYIEKSGYNNQDILRGYSRLLERKLVEKEQTARKEQSDVEKLIILNRKSYALSHDTHTLYRVGQLELGLGHQAKAAAAFAEVVAKAPQKVYYRPAAEKLAERLRNQGIN